MPLAKVIAYVKRNPKFAAMRSVARFGAIRGAVKQVRGMSQRSRWSAYRDEQKARMGESIFHDCDPEAFRDALLRDGVALGLRLPDAIVGELCAIAEKEPCYADRDPRLGFRLADRARAEHAVGKPILLAQFFNMDRFPVVARLRDDPFLRLIAAEYLRSLPTHVGTNAWWTFPVQASAADKLKHAHLFHNDVDDFAFLKFFFYLTDVDADDGAHVCVPGSNRSPLICKTSDRWRIRRYQDDEVQGRYGRSGILYVAGPKGTGFAEDTLCLHKGTTPVRRSRLLIQFQYALFDYTIQRDAIDPSRLAMIA